MCNTEIKTGYRVISFFMVIAFVLSSMYQTAPNFYLLAAAQEYSEVKLMWEDKTEQQPKVFSFEDYSEVSVKARLKVNLTVDDAYKAIALPKYLYESSSGYPAPELDVSALEEKFDAAYDEENQKYNLTAKNADSEIYCDVIYRTLQMQKVEENDFTISAVLGEVGNEICRSELSGRICIEENTDTITTDEQDNVVQITEPEQLPKISENIMTAPINRTLKTADNDPNLTNLVVFKWHVNNAEQGVCTLSSDRTEATWEFYDRTQNSFQAELEINANRQGNMEITVPKYAYQYRDSSWGGELDIRNLESTFDVNDNKNNTYTLKIKDEQFDLGEAFHNNVILNYQNMSVVRTSDNTEFNLEVTYTSTDKPEPTVSTIKGKIITDINEITVTKNATSDIDENGKFKSFDELSDDAKAKLLARYGYTGKEEEFKALLNESESVPDGKEIIFGDYIISGTVTGCQPYTAMLKETPENGEVIAVQNGQVFLSGDSLVKNNDGYYEFVRKYNAGSDNNSVNFKQAVQYRVLVRYTVTKGERTLKNEAEIKAAATEKATAVTGKARLNHVDAEVEEDYDANIWGIHKGYYRVNQDSTINILENGGNKQFRFQVTGYANTIYYLNNRKTFDSYQSWTESEKPAFRAEVIDDVMFVKGTDDNYYELNSDDYEYNKLDIYPKVAKMSGVWSDSKTGYNYEEGRPLLMGESDNIDVEASLNNASDGKISVFVCQENSDGWKEVLSQTDIADVAAGRDTMQNHAMTGVTATRDKTGKITISFGTIPNIYRVKVVYEETELQKNEIQVELYGQWKGAGSTFTTNSDVLFKDNDAIAFVNWAGIQGFRNNESTMELSKHVGNNFNDWQNPVDITCIGGGSKGKVHDFDTTYYSSEGDLASNTDVGEKGCVILPNSEGWSCGYNGSTNNEHKDGTSAKYIQRAGTTLLAYRNSTYGGAAKWHDGVNGGTIAYNLVAMQGSLAGFPEDLNELIEENVMKGSEQAVFYDLLPAGMVYDKVEPLSGNVVVNDTSNGTYTWRFNSGEDGFFPQGGQLNKIYGLKPYDNVTVDITENYKDTGRQFVKITVTYNIYPMAYFMGGQKNNNPIYSQFFSIKLFAKSDESTGKGRSTGFIRPNYQNYFAAQFFDKDNHVITSGNECVMPNNGNYFKGLKEEFDNLGGNKKNDDERTVVYATAYHNGSNDGNGTVVSKAIKADEHDEIFKLKTDTDLGEGYTYRLKYSVFNGTSNNLVLYDVLENSKYDSAGINISSKNRWHGTLDYIDVKETAEKFGLKKDEIKVYYSENTYTEEQIASGDGGTGGLKPKEFTKENSEWQSAPLNNNFRWTNNLEDPTAVKTIAVYFENLEMSSADKYKNTATVYLHMKASAETADYTNRAYNEVAYYNELNGSETGTTQFGNAVDIGLKLGEKTFSIKKNFVKDGVARSYYGDVSFTIQQLSETEPPTPPLSHNDDYGVPNGANTNSMFTAMTDSAGNWETKVDENDTTKATLTMHFRNQTTLTAKDFVKVQFPHEGTYKFKVTETACTSTEGYVATKSSDNYEISVKVDFTDIGNIDYEISEVKTTRNDIEYTEKIPEFTNEITNEPDALVIETPFRIRKTFAGKVDSDTKFYFRILAGSTSGGTLYYSSNEEPIGNNASKYIGVTIEKDKINDYSQLTMFKFEFSHEGTYLYAVNEAVIQQNKYVDVVNSTIQTYDYDKSRYQIIVVVKKDSNGKLYVESQTIKKIRDRAGASVNQTIAYSLIGNSSSIPIINFTNAPKTTTDTAIRGGTITIWKTFYDYNCENIPQNGFNFKVESYDDFSKDTILPVSGNDALSEQTYTVNVAKDKTNNNMATGESGKVRIKFPKQGVYRYLISEIPPNDTADKKMYYDKSVYLLTFNIQKNDSDALFVKERLQYKLVDSDGKILEIPERVSGTQFDFTNKLGAVEVAPPVVKKNVEILYDNPKYDQTIDEKEYTFKMECTSAEKSDSTPAPTPQFDDTLTIKTNGDETVSGEFGKVLFWEEGTYEFEISEQPNDYSVIDTSVYKWTVTVKKNTADDGTISYSIDSPSLSKGNKSISINDGMTFDNQYINNGTFKIDVKKTLVKANDITLSADEEKIKTFDFEILAANETPNAPLPLNPQMSITIDENSNGTGTFGVINFNDVVLTENDTKSYKYIIKEIKPENANPHLNYDKIEYAVVIEIKKTNGIIRVNRYKYTGKNKTFYDKELELQFTNTWHETTDTKFDIPLTKNIIAGEKDETLQTNGRTFNFVLTPLKSGNPMPKSNEISITFNKNDLSQTASFGTITFEKDGEYLYQITESTDNKDDNLGWVYDKSVYLVKVSLYHGMITAAYMLDGETVDKIEFTNKYYPPVAMPSAGGMGANEFFLFGGSLIFIGGCWLVLKQFRKAEG